PLTAFEVIVMNDQSTDRTAAVVEEFQKHSPLRLRLYHLGESENNTSPKKRAISEALKVASGRYIVTTDGDCAAEEGWLRAYLNAFTHTGAVFISAPVTFFGPQRGAGLWSKVWNHLQTVEFASLIGSGACSMALGFPNMCSGANIGY